MAQMTTSEHQLQEKCLRWLKSQRGLWFLKIFGSGVQTGGVPDIIICKKGRFVAVELKRPDGTGKVHPRQQAQIQRIIRAGGVAVVIDNYDDFVKLVEGI